MLSWTPTTNSKTEKHELEQTVILILRSKEVYFLKMSSESFMLYTHALNIADVIVYNPEYVDKNPTVLALSVLYLVLFKALNFNTLGQARNPVQREHILDCRPSAPLNLVFTSFLSSMHLDLDFECLAQDLRFADLYVSFPLLTESDFGGFVQSCQNSSLLKPVGSSNLQTYYRDRLTLQRHFSQTIEFDRLLASSDDC